MAYIAHSIARAVKTFLDFAETEIKGWQWHQLETSGGTLLAADMVVLRRDGPRRLSDHDDADDDWHQLDHMQVICTSLQTDDHASTSSPSFYRAKLC